jgi:hypothetical protein
MSCWSRTASPQRKISTFWPPTSAGEHSGRNSSRALGPTHRSRRAGKKRTTGFVIISAKMTGSRHRLRSSMPTSPTLRLLRRCGTWPAAWGSTVTTTQRTRDPFVIEHTKRRAKGVCQLCGNAAPFNNKKGEPFLEVHHIEWLARGGDDSIKKRGGTLSKLPQTNAHLRPSEGQAIPPVSDHLDSTLQPHR